MIALRTLSIVLLALTGSAFAGTQTSPGHNTPRFQGVYLAEITEMNLDDEYFQGETFEGGKVSVDFDNMNVVITLYSECIPKSICTLEAEPLDSQASKIIELPIVSADITRCGLSKVRAEENKMPVGGFLKIIQIQEYDSSIIDPNVACPRRIAYGPTRVQFVTVSSRTLKETISTFITKKLFNF